MFFLQQTNDKAYVLRFPRLRFAAFEAVEPQQLFCQRIQEFFFANKFGAGFMEQAGFGAEIFARLLFGSKSAHFCCYV